MTMTDYLFYSNYILYSASELWMGGAIVNLDDMI